MKFTTRHVLAALIAAVLTLGLFGPMPGAAAAAADDTTGSDKELDVGHRIEPIVVPGSSLCPDLNQPCTLEPRQVDVHLWYPADEEGLSQLGKTEYTSRLWDDDRVTRGPLGWTPLSWKVEAEIAREDANIDPSGAAFPVIVFSHGATNDPIDYAHTLELIASAGFVVAAPQHVNNSQDDVRIDYVNTQARTTLIPCNDGLPSPCSRGGNVPRSMRDRARDISSVLDALPNWFGGRVDVSRAGVMGHSRGTVTALAAAGGSSFWGFAAGEARVKAIMGLAIGVQNITDKVDFADVTVPTLLVAGTLDETSPPAVSQFAFNSLTSTTDKAFVLIENARHRSFDSTYCDQTQAAGTIAQANPNARLDLHTVTGIVAPGGGAGTSGRATEFCNSKTFTEPVKTLVTAITGFDFTTQNVPTTGLDTDDVKEQVKELAATFFGRALQ
jgi:predicted dienelactone hydrolase